MVVKSNNNKSKVFHDNIYHWLFTHGQYDDAKKHLLDQCFFEITNQRLTVEPSAERMRLKLKLKDAMTGLKSCPNVDSIFITENEKEYLRNQNMTAATSQVFTYVFSSFCVLLTNEEYR